MQAGQGTAALELLEAVPAIGMVVAPVSGGGLLSGTAIAAHGIDPTIPVWGAEPLAVDDAFRSLAAGHLVLDGAGDTIADGLVAQLSDTTLAILQAHERAGGHRHRGRDRGGDAPPGGRRQAGGGAQRRGRPWPASSAWRTAATPSPPTSA